MEHPAPEAIWGPGVVYIVCRPECLPLAELDDAVHEAVGCFDPTCPARRRIGL